MKLFLRRVGVALFLLSDINVLHADSARILVNGTESLAAHINAIRAAQRSIDLASYILEPCDSSGKLLLGALADKARRGISVRVMIDAFQLHRDKRELLIAYFAANNIQFKIFNDFILGNSRSHQKLLLIDGVSRKPTLFADGRNLTDRYFGLAPQDNYIGTDLVLHGQAGIKARVSFDELWTSDLASTPSATTAAFDLGSTCLAMNDRDLQVAKQIKAATRDQLSAELPHNCPDAEYVWDDPNFMKAGSRQLSADGVSPIDFMTAKRMSKKRMTAAMLDFVAGARRTLVLEGPYYLPAIALTAAFVAARDRGVQLLVLTNRKADPDIDAVVDDMTYFMARAIDRDTSGAMRVLPISNLGALNGGGGKRSKGAPWIIHAKTAVRDHRDVMMSSFNLDQRSYDTDLEAGVVIRNCPGLARELEAHYRQLVQAYTDDLRNCDRCKQDPMPTGASPLGYLLGNFF